MNENVAYRKGFLRGMIEGIKLYAVWKNGEQFVGVLRIPLKEALAPYEIELEQIEEQESA